VQVQVPARVMLPPVALIRFIELVAWYCPLVPLSEASAVNPGVFIGLAPFSLNVVKLCFYSSKDPATARRRQSVSLQASREPLSTSPA
jgi:hypothetical protein